MNLKAILLGSFLLSSTALVAHDGEHDHSTKATAPITSAVQTGQGNLKYTTVPGWGKIPGNDYIGSTHGGIVVDKAGNVYVSTDGPNNLTVFSEDGKFIRSFGPETRRIHGMNINEENGTEYIYAAAMGKVHKLSLDGKIVMSLDGSKQDGHSWKKATAVAVAPNGDIFIADGYGSSLIFKYDKTGKLIKKIGIKGSKDGEFKTSHGLALDNRNPDKPLLLVADRENRRMQILDLDGKFIKVATTGLRRPCALSIWGDYVAVAELQGRVVILDKDFKVVSKIGDNPNQKQWAKFPAKPEEWQGGIFTAPHGVSFDSKGNLYVMDWNRFGRVTKLTKDN